MDFNAEGASEVYMNEEANTLIVRECYARFVNHDIPGLLELFTDDIDWTMPDIENVPFAGTRFGVESVGEYFSLLAKAEEITHFEAQEFIAQGDKVVVVGRSTSNVVSTGRHYSTEWVHICTLKEGKIKSFHEFLDSASAARAFQKVTGAF